MIEIPSSCPYGPHRFPEGPNEDVAQCRHCSAPTHAMRPEHETIGLHLDDCSLPIRHEGRCVGGGEGHPVAPVVRGYWKNMEEDVAAARERHGSLPDPRTRTE